MEYGVWSMGVWSMAVWGYGIWGYGGMAVWGMHILFILLMSGSIRHTVNIIIIPVIIIICNHVCKCVKSTMGEVKL